MALKVIRKCTLENAITNLNAISQQITSQVPLSIS